MVYQQDQSTSMFKKLNFLVSLVVLFVSLNTFAMVDIVGDRLKLRPGTIPTTCSVGQVFSKSSDGLLYYCGAVNTWSALVGGTVGPTSGGTGITTYATGDTLYASAANTLSKLTGNITTTKKYLSQTGNGAVSAAPTWDSSIPYSDLVLTGSILGSDIAQGTISYGKLTVAGSILGTDLTLGTVSYGRLSLAGSLLGTDLTLGTVSYGRLSLAGSLLGSDLTLGTVSYGRLNLASSVLGSDLALTTVSYGRLNLADGSIPRTKLATGTVSQGLLNDSSGNIVTVSYNGELNTILPSQVGNSGKYLTTDGNNSSWGSVSAGAALQYNYTSQSASYSAAINDYVCESAGDLTLPTAASQNGKTVVFEHCGTNFVKINVFTTSSQTITYNGTTYTNADINTNKLFASYTNGEKWIFVSDNSNWRVLDHKAVVSLTSFTQKYSATSAYVFTVTAANATAGATYTNSGFTYTVKTTIAGTTTLTCAGTGTPAASGTLTKAAGTGDATITYSSKTITGQPIKSSSSSLDTAYWSREGRYIVIKTNYYSASTTGATAGTGDFLFAPPTGAAIDTTAGTGCPILTNITDAITQVEVMANAQYLNCPATGNSSIATNYYVFHHAVPFSDSWYRIYGLYLAGNTESYPLTSANESFTSAAFGFSFEVRFPGKDATTGSLWLP
jgi:hypothetical protein